MPNQAHPTNPDPTPEWVFELCRSILDSAFTLLMPDMVASCLVLAFAAHEEMHEVDGVKVPHRRKWTGEPYIFHPVRVAAEAARWGLPPHAVAGLLLHDALEDTTVSRDVLKDVLPWQTMRVVDDLTERDHPGNRAARKAAECDRLARCSPHSQTGKLLDIEDNARSIARHDPNFWPVFYAEATELVRHLTGADPDVSEHVLVVLDRLDLQHL